MLYFSVSKICTHFGAEKELAQGSSLRSQPCASPFVSTEMGADFPATEINVQFVYFVNKSSVAVLITC